MDELKRQGSGLRTHWRRLPAPARQVGAVAVGGALLVAGIALLVLPGPGLLLIALALAVLSAEFAWPRRLLHTGRAWIDARRAEWGRRPTAGHDGDRDDPAS